MKTAALFKRSFKPQRLRVKAGKCQKPGSIKHTRGRRDEREAQTKEGTGRTKETSSKRAKKGVQRDIDGIC